MTYKSIPYTFNKMSNGTDGKGIKATAITYQVGTSGVTAPTGTWQSSIPSVGASQFLWTRIVITYTDNSTSTVYTVGMMGAKGDKGDTGSTGGTGPTGPTGTGIESITTEYYLSTSKTAQSGGSWSTTMPSWSYGKYLWIRSKVVYKNPTSTAYTVAYCDSSWEAVKNVENDILAWCYNNDKTYINGSKIYARSITSNQLATDSIKSTNYVANSVGSFLNLADGSFDSKYLKWTKEGVITATSGYIAGIKIDATKLTASSTSGSITSGYQITNNGEISAYSNGSGINSSLYLTGDKVQLISMTTAGSQPKELTISTTGLTLQSEGTQVGYITASGDGMNIFGNRGIHAKSNFYADNVPTAGAFDDSGVNFGFGDLKGYPCFLGSVYQTEDKTWYNAISVRHRNGLVDGNQYGMFIRSIMTSTTSKLVWNQQYGGNWGADRTILDSSGGIINGKLEILDSSSSALYVRGGIAVSNVYFNTDVYSSINGRPGGGFDFWFNSNGARIVFEPTGKIYRVTKDDVWTVIAG